MDDTIVKIEPGREEEINLSLERDMVLSNGFLGIIKEEHNTTTNAEYCRCDEMQQQQHYLSNITPQTVKFTCKVCDYVTESSIDDDKYADYSVEGSISDSSENDLSEPKEPTTLQPSTPIPKKYKQTYCILCDALITSKHFSRHLNQRHKEENIVNLMNEKSGKERTDIIAKIRNKGNLALQKRTGKLIPKRKEKKGCELVASEFITCSLCKAFFKKTYLTRHNKKCGAHLKNKGKERPHVGSFTFSLEEDYQAYLKGDPLRSQLVHTLRMDEIGKVVVADPIILEYGTRILETAKNTAKRLPVARNKMRECARILIQVKEILPNPGSIKTIVDILKPEYIDYMVSAVMGASKFSDTERSFGSAFFALHQGKTINDLIDVATYAICKKDSLVDGKLLEHSDIVLKELETLKKLIEANWANSSSSSEEETTLKNKKQVSVVISSNVTPREKDRVSFSTSSSSEEDMEDNPCQKPHEDKKRHAKGNGSRGNPRIEHASASFSSSQSDIHQQRAIKRKSKATILQIRKGWPPEEINLIKAHLGKYLLKDSTYPNTKQMKDFIEKYLKNERTVPQLRSKIQHLKKGHVVVVQPLM